MANCDRNLEQWARAARGGGEAKKRKLDPMPAHNENVAGLNIVAGSYSNEQWLVEAPQAEKIRGYERGMREG